MALSHILSLSCLFLLLPPVLSAPLGQDSEPLVRTLYQYPKGTWLENIAIRPNGNLLVTLLLPDPELHQIEPFVASPTPENIHTFHGYLGLSGIAEIAPDTFAVAAGNVSFTAGGQRGSWSVWKVNFPAPHKIHATISKIADVLGAKELDGMCNLPSPKVPQNILVGDLEEGVVRRVDTTTGEVKITLNDTITAATKDPIVGTSGVNGIHVHNGALYLTNTAKHIFASIPIRTDGAPTGQPTIIQDSHKSELIFSFDDFAIVDEDAYLVTGSGNAIERIGLDGTPKGRIVAGNLSSTQIAGPTSAAFGRTERDRHILYVVTSGAFAAPVDGNTTVGAQVLAIDTRQWPC